MNGRTTHKDTAERPELSLVLQTLWFDDAEKAFSHSNNNYSGLSEDSSKSREGLRSYPQNIWML